MGIHVSGVKERIVKENLKILYVCTFRGYEKIREVDNGSNRKNPNISYLWCVIWNFFDFNFYIGWMFLFPNAKEIIALGNRQLFLN
jgi:hypothetical protein